MIYEQILKFYNGIAAVRVGEKWGFVNKNHEIVIPPVYDEICEIHKDAEQVWFWNNRINIRKGDKWGYIDSRGREKTPFIYDFAGFFEGGCTTVENNGVQIIVDVNGNIIFPNLDNYDSVYVQHSGRYIVVSKNSLYGVVKANGEVLVPLAFTFESVHNAFVIMGILHSKKEVVFIDQ